MLDSLIVVDVGHGSCAVLHEGGEAAVIDAGPGSALLEYLVRAQVKEIHLVLVSHSDEDHLGGLIALLGSDEFVVRNILLNSDSMKDSKAWDDLRALIDEKTHQGKLNLKLGVFAGPINEWALGKTALHAVCPSAAMAMGGAGSRSLGGRKVTQNTNSIAVRVLYDGKPLAFLAADIDSVTLEDIKAHKTDCSAPYLVFPHHGGRPGAGDPVAFASALVDLVRPNHVIFSNGRGKHDAPRPEIVQVLMGFKGLRVGCTQMSKQCCADPLRAPSVHVSGHYSHGAAKGHSCTGTIEISLQSGQIASPLLGSHSEFVRSFPNAMCRSSLPPAT